MLYRADGTLMNSFSALSNQRTGMGVAGRDKLQSVEINIDPYILDREQLGSLHRSSKLIEKVVELLPDDAAANWGDWRFPDDDDEELARDIGLYCDRLELIDNFNEAASLGRLYGDGYILLDIKDGKAINEPVDMGRIKSVEIAGIVDRDELRPDPSFGYRNPKTYYLNVELDAPQFDGVSRGFSTIHSDRVLRFPGKRLRSYQLQRNQGNNDSVIQSLFNGFSIYMQSFTSVSTMLSDANLFVYMLDGLSQLAKRNETDKLISRFAALQMSMSNLKGLTIDKDNEAVDYLARNFGGIDKILERVENFFLAETGYPRTKLFNHSGANSLSESGKTDERLWANLVASYQRNIWTGPRRRVSELIIAAKDGPDYGGRVLLGWTSLIQLSDKEKAEIAKLEAETAAILAELPESDRPNAHMDAASDPKNPAEPHERTHGSSKNIELNEVTVTALEDKVSAHNEAHPEKSKRATVEALKKVWRRGAGAYSTSHRRTVKSRSQWAMGRVNAYLYLLRQGKPKNRNYTTDNDLLPAGHPRSSRKDELPFEDGEWDAIASDVSSPVVVEEVLGAIDDAVGGVFSEEV
ncbi:DUF1073 domain-containing protein [Leptolyngbyaceae cyanobacterium CCMR0082]|uniref:DUF1073 domain-containing protein n=1 Tax=Adonisia turfae CCMR0082 TaxID=2304604 RepID=A0A6M0S857_9CYAN|nr:anti-CBASS Acb1 family protein [Adonisia turfae]NEZ64648.1 DUF1073 domain-containing protein [Adonisia turfae CCMR0082]